VFVTQVGGVCQSASTLCCTAANVLCSARRFLRAVGARLAVLIWLCERRLYVVMMSTESGPIFYMYVFVSEWVNARAALCTTCKVKINRDALFKDSNQFALFGTAIFLGWISVRGVCRRLVYVLGSNWLLLVCKTWPDMTFHGSNPSPPSHRRRRRRLFALSCKKQSGRCAASQNMHRTPWRML